MGKIKFSCWVKWENRQQQLKDDLRHPGIYALAISISSLADKSFSWDREIVYFGMTNSATGLKGRLKQFDNTINGKDGHGGAWRFRYDHPNYTELISKLYVAVSSFECKVTSNKPSDLLIMGDVAKAEYECWAEYVAKFNQLPKYNDKKNSPKYQPS